MILTCRADVLLLDINLQEILKLRLTGKKVIAAALPAEAMPDDLTTATSTSAFQAGPLNLREAQSFDLESVNELIAAAMNTWNLTNRVKRISLPLYRYQLHDLEYLQIVVAATVDSRITGVAALERAHQTDLPDGLSASILHGLYVTPDWHRKGIGSLLLERIETIARSEGAAGLLAKARPEAMPFFESCGFEKLPVEDHARDYPHRFYKHF
jgi:GNAT superfamily N-acetyltransferase